VSGRFESGGVGQNGSSRVAGGARDKTEITHGRRLLPAVAFAALAMGGGCLDRPVAPSDPKTTNIFVGEVKQSAVDKIDLLFMIDNSMSMRDKQDILSQAVPVLVQRLIDPRPDPTTGQPEFKPVQDIHVGIITSSLGAHGGDQCQDGMDDDDHAHLLGKVRDVASWADSGFLAWDPLAVIPAQAKKNPPGETNSNAFVDSFKAMIDAVGQTGCGYESSLEAWYRFLIDPEPPLAVVRENNVLVPQGVDEAVLEQRGAFLRPDSLVAIVMLSDENDCSIRDDGAAWLLGKQGAMPRATSACAVNPNDPCCRSCRSLEPNGPPQGCTSLANDPECTSRGEYLNQAQGEDHANLRCYDQKRRFGLDLLYPTSRYVEALTAPQIRKRDGTLVPNPLLVSATGRSRDPGLVFLAGIVGVPWQDIADRPSLEGPGLKYLTAEQLANGNVWATILGDPASGTLPADPLMIETPNERSGIHPATGAPLQPSSSSTPNPVNGREQTNVGNSPLQNSDLQYACTFRLPEPRPCAEGDLSCDCTATDLPRNRSLCSPSGAGPAETTQYWAKAYPGVRQLQVLRDFGPNAIVASICPKVLDGDNGDPSYGYNPAVEAIIDRLTQVLGGKCLPRALVPETALENFGKVPCVVIEASASEGECVCDASKRRKEPVAAVREPVQQQLALLGQCGTPGRPACKAMCLCEIEQTEGAARETCQNDPVPEPSATGYCYVDAESDPPIGSEKVVENCSPKRMLRFVGDETPKSGATAIIACIGATLGGN
jgi:hypothetical protein